jgi:uncharacterized protein
MPGLRVLVLDGGGARGLFTIEMLKFLEMTCGRPIRECFDLIVGTSAGGFIAGCLVAGKTLDEIESGFWSVIETFEKARPSTTSFVSRLLWGHVLDSSIFAEQLTDFVGRTTMQDLPASPRLLLVATDASTVVPHPFLIRNRPLPDEVASRSPFASTTAVTVTDALRAVAAAPTFYPHHTLDDKPIVDGAVHTNNPVFFALTEATLLGPSLDCIVSIGTGTELRVPHTVANRGMVGWVSAVVRRAPDTETPEMLMRGLLPPSKYIRFDPTGAGECHTWESDKKTLLTWRKGVQAYMHDQQETLAALVPRLCFRDQDNEDGPISNRSGP